MQVGSQKHALAKTAGGQLQSALRVCAQLCILTLLLLGALAAMVQYNPALAKNSVFQSVFPCFAHHGFFEATSSDDKIISSSYPVITRESSRRLSAGTSAAATALEEAAAQDRTAQAVAKLQLASLRRRAAKKASTEAE